MMMTRSVTVSMSASCGQIAGQIAFDPDYLAHDLRDEGKGRSDQLIRVTMLSHARFSFIESRTRPLTFHRSTVS